MNYKWVIRENYVDWLSDYLAQQPGHRLACTELNSCSPVIKAPQFSFFPKMVQNHNCSWSDSQILPTILQVPALTFDANNFSLWGSGEWWMLLAAQSMAIGTVMVRWVSKYSDPVMATGWVRRTIFHVYQHQIFPLIRVYRFVIVPLVTYYSLKVYKDHSLYY